MRKSEMKKATVQELVIDYIFTYGDLSVNINLGRGTIKNSKHLADLDRELLNRGFFTQEQIELLNM